MNDVKFAVETQAEEAMEMANEWIREEAELQRSPQSCRSFNTKIKWPRKKVKSAQESLRH